MVLKMMLISYIVLLIMVMVSVGFFVLLERKILGSIHLREGPEKISIVGLLQPLSDGGKLFSKGFNFPIKGNYMFFFISPILSLFLCFLSWLLYKLSFDEINMVLGFLIFLCLSSLNVYVMVMSGWSSNSIYSVMGSYRGIAQCISYEVTMALIMIGMISLVGSYNLKMFLFEKGLVGVCFFSMIVWFSVVLAETNRSPYDFIEGESELVSGFNVEYSSIGFSMLFLGEYGMMLFFSYLSSNMFSEGSYFVMISLIISFIWIRGILPRFRYDKLMDMTWKFYLYYSLCCLIFYLGMVNIMVYIY